MMKESDHISNNNGERKWSHIIVITRNSDIDNNESIIDYKTDVEG